VNDFWLIDIELLIYFDFILHCFDIVGWFEEHKCSFTSVLS